VEKAFEFENVRNGNADGGRGFFNPASGLLGIDPELGAFEGRKRVREVVKCEARVERLLGGDREMA